MTTVRAVKIENAKGTRAVTVVCPFCGREHHHGWPYGAEEIGGRASHCRGGSKDYNILPPRDYRPGADR